MFFFFFFFFFFLKERPPQQKRICSTITVKMKLLPYFPWYINPFKMCYSCRKEGAHIGKKTIHWIICFYTKIKTKSKWKDTWTPQLLIVLVLNFEQVNFNTCWCVRNRWMSVKSCVLQHLIWVYTVCSGLSLEHWACLGSFETPNIWLIY